MLQCFYMNPKNDGTDHDNPVAVMGNRVFYNDETLKDKKDLNNFKDYIHSLLIDMILKEADIGEIGLTEKRVRFTNGEGFEKLGVKQLYVHENQFIIYEGVIEPLITFNTQKVNDKLKSYVMDLTGDNPSKESRQYGLELITHEIRGKEKDIVLIVHPELKTFVLKEKPLV